MLLTRHSGVIIEPERIVYGDLQGAPPFKRELAASSDYIDVSGIENWAIFGQSGTRVDYKVVRAEIKALYSRSVWADLTQTEQEVCSRWFVATRAERIEVHTFAEQVLFGKEFHAASVGARTLRRNEALIEIYNRLAKAEANSVIDDVNGLLSKYVEFGREGTLEGDSEGLFDYVEARTETSFAATGFAKKTWTPIGHADMAAFSVAVMSILRDGVY